MSTIELSPNHKELLTLNNNISKLGIDCMLNLKIPQKNCLIKTYNLIQLHATCHTNIMDKAAA